MNEILKKRIEKEANDYAYKKWVGGGFEIASNDSFTAGGIFALTHQWISVNKALPELMERVLVAYRLTGRISICIMKRIPHDSSDPNNGKWHWSLVNHKEDVIAWMPIPKFDN